MWTQHLDLHDSAADDAREVVEAEEIGAWSEHGQNWWRLRVRLLDAREFVMYFSNDGLLRGGDMIPIAIYSSAHDAYSGLVVPTLHRAVTRNTASGVSRKTTLLDIEIFDANFD